MKDVANIEGAWITMDTSDENAIWVYLGGKKSLIFWSVSQACIYKILVHAMKNIFLLLCCTNSV